MSGGIIDPGLFAGITNELQKLRQHHGLQNLLNQLKSSYKYAGGPFAGSSPTIHSRLGANPGQVVGTFHAPDGFQNAFNEVLGISGALGQALHQQSNPMNDLYNSLLDQLQQPVASPTGIDRNDLMNQVKQAINPIYDQQIQSATAANQRQRGDVTNMYAALKQDYKNLIPQAKAQQEANQKQLQDMYGELRSNIQGNYARTTQDQADLFKQLGIESALPSVLDKQNPSVTDALTAASENQTQQQQQYMDTGNADQTYYQEQQPISTMTGIETNNNLMNQLNDYVNQANAQRASALQSTYMDQLGQAQNQLAQQQQLAQSEQARRQEMLWQILSSQMQNSAKAQALTPDTFMGQLSPQQQMAVGSAFTQLQRSPEAIYGKVEDPRNPVPGSFVNTTPEWYYSQADQLYKNGQIDAATHQQLLEYLQLYFGGK